MTFYMRPLAQMGEKRFGHCWILLTNVDGQLPSGHVVCKNQTSLRGNLVFADHAEISRPSLCPNLSRSSSTNN